MDKKFLNELSDTEFYNLVMEDLPNNQIFNAFGNYTIQNYFESSKSDHADPTRNALLGAKYNEIINKFGRLFSNDNTLSIDDAKKYAINGINNVLALTVLFDEAITKYKRTNRKINIPVIQGTFSQPLSRLYVRKASIPTGDSIGILVARDPESEVTTSRDNGQSIGINLKEDSGRYIFEKDPTNLSGITLYVEGGGRINGSEEPIVLGKIKNLEMLFSGTF